MENSLFLGVPILKHMRVLTWACLIKGHVPFDRHFALYITYYLNLVNLCSCEKNEQFLWKKISLLCYFRKKSVYSKCVVS